MEENKYFDWLRRHASKILMAVICLTAGGIFLDRWLNKHKSSTQQDFVTVKHLFEPFLSGRPLAAESVEAIEKILGSHPELHPKYDSLMALAYFQQENSAKGVACAQMALQRAEKLTQTHYQDFTKATLLIAQKNYKEALTQAQQLESTLQNDASLEMLRTFNLLRIAMLARELGELSLAKQSWESVQKMSAFEKVSPLFQEGSYSLSNYFYTQMS